MKLTQEERLVLVGLTALALEERKKLNSPEGAVCGFLKRHGVDETTAKGWAGELVYNEGDDPIVAADSVLASLGIEVEA